MTPPNRLTPPPNQNKLTSFKFQPISKMAGNRAVVYGPGGIGKTLLSLLAEGPTAIADADESISVLRNQLDEMGVTLPRIVPCNDWGSLRACLQAEGWGDTKTIILDTATKIEEWCTAWTIKYVPHEKGNKVTRIEDYGWGKGQQHVFDSFLPLLGDLDRHVRLGRNVILVAHECVSSVPNPTGEDWIRYEPRLQDPKSGKASIRLRLKEWADHVLFLGYDVAVKDGRGKGSGTRTLYTTELPFCMAKSRTTSDMFVIEKGQAPWASIFK